MGFRLPGGPARDSRNFPRPGERGQRTRLFRAHIIEQAVNPLTRSNRIALRREEIALNYGSIVLALGFILTKSPRTT